MTSVADVNLETIDLLDESLFQDGPPHELFARMREETPIRWNTVSDGSGFWSLTRHEEISYVSKSPEIFSSWRAGVFLEPDLVLPLDVNRNLLLYKDPPEHTKYRKILNTAFTPNTVKKMEEAIRDRITEVIDDVIEAGTCDFAQDIAVPVPLKMLISLMGLPDEDFGQLLEWTDGIEEAQRSGEPGGATELFMGMAGYLMEQVQKQIAEGQEDSLVMRLRNAEVDGEKLDDAEILVFFGLLVFAGNDTTRNTAASGVKTLLEHPDQFQKLKDDPSLIDAAVEEILRYTSVVQYFVRTATQDTEILGQKIAEDEKVMIWYTSASRDESVFDDPQTFDITRNADGHKAFGGGGRHFCLGAGLARAELRILLQELIRRTPDIELDGDVKRLPSAWANMVTGLPVKFTPGTREG